MRPELLPAIEALKSEVADLEGKVAAARAMTNRMCEMAGVPLVYADVGIQQRAAADITRADLYYGKSLITAAREFLEARNGAGRGPAAPREIYDGLVAGGLQFESESDTVRLIGLRAALRKNSGTFHKLPNGQYGLLAWYPKVRAAKSEDDAEAAAPVKRAKPLSRIKRNAKGPVARAQRARAVPAAAGPKSPLDTVFDVFALEAMADGKSRNAAELKKQAVERGGVGVEPSTDLRSLVVRLLALARQGKMVSEGNGVWRIAEKKTTPPVDASGVVHAFKGAA